MFQDLEPGAPANCVLTIVVIGILLSGIRVAIYLWARYMRWIARRLE